RARGCKGDGVAGPGVGRSWVELLGRGRVPEGNRAVVRAGRQQTSVGRKSHMPDAWLRVLPLPGGRVALSGGAGVRPPSGGHVPEVERVLGPDRRQRPTVRGEGEGPNPAGFSPELAQLLSRTH